MRKFLILAACLFITAQLLAQTGVIKGKNDLYLANTVVIKLKQAPTADFNGNALLPAGVKSSMAPYSVTSSVQEFPPQANRLFKESGGLERIVSLHYTSGEDPLVISKKLARLKDVEWAEPKYIRKVTYDVNDPMFDPLTQYNLYITKAKEAWDISRGDKSIVIGIVDDGVYWGHPDLAANIHQNLGEDANHNGVTIIWDGTQWIPDPGDLNGIDDDGNGYVDDLVGWDFGGDNGTPDNNPEEDVPTHGTLVAGIAGAVTNNGIGIASMGFNCSLLPVKCSRKDMDPRLIIYGYEGIKYAADNGAKIINCSFTGYAYSHAEQEIINYAISKGALVIAAAGNDNIDLPAYPASYQGVLSVGATNAADKMWSASNYGGTIDVTAPGQQIYGTWGKDSYTVANGTSLAAPITAGLAGLIKSRFPDYTPLQIGEQIRATSDDISSLNADSLKYKMGKGRINAYNALTITNAVSVRATNIQINDEGNHNGIIQSGELASISTDFVNYLSPVQGVQVTLSTDNQYISIENSTFNTGAMASLGTVSNSSNKFYFKVKSWAPYNLKVNFLLTYSASGYSDYQMVQVIINQTYNTIAENNIALTVASSGNIGYDDYPNNLQGQGLRFMGGENLLFEGSFMYGTSAATLADAARIDNNSKSINFKTLSPFTIKNSSSHADLEGSAIFNDDYLGTSKLGIETKLIAYEYKESPYDNFVILRAVLANKTGADINNLYAGWFLDFDLDGTDYDNNNVSYDSANKIIYAYDRPDGPFKYYVGASLLTGQNTGVFAIDNTLDNNGLTLYPSFTKSAKWQMLSGGIAKTSAGTGDISLIISGGPVNIKAGSYENISFVLAIGNTPADLKTIISNSRAKYASIPNDAGNDPVEIPANYYLSQNFPNPFNNFTKIIYDLPKDDYVKIKVYDILGREIVTLVNAFQTAGKNYSVMFNGASVPSGIYFYRIETTSYRQTKKMVVVK